MIYLKTHPLSCHPIIVCHMYYHSPSQIDFVAHDDLPYNTGDTDDIYKEVKDMGRFVANQRTPGVSTSDLISRIVKNYDMYLKRNFARGYTAKDMNVGFIKVGVAIRMWVGLFHHPWACAYFVSMTWRELWLPKNVWRI